MLRLLKLLQPPIALYFDGPIAAAEKAGMVKKMDFKDSKGKSAPEFIQKAGRAHTASLLNKVSKGKAFRGYAGGAEASLFSSKSKKSKSKTKYTQGLTSAQYAERQQRKTLG